MSVIVPAILPYSLQELEETLDRLAVIEGVETVQFDIIDGVYAQPADWPYNEGMRAFAERARAGQLLPHVGRLKFEVDLMVHAPEETIGAWIASGVSRITVHAESAHNLGQLLQDFNTTYGHDKGFMPNLLSIGLALGLGSDLSLIEPYLDRVDYVQFMGISRIGLQGQPFDERVLERVKMFKQKHPDMLVQVDGAVTERTEPLLLEAGADRLVVGHDLLQAKDMHAKFDKLSQIAAAYTGRTAEARA